MRSRLICREVGVLGKRLQQRHLWWRHFALGKRDAVEKIDYAFRDRAKIVQNRLVECDAPQRTTPSCILAFEIARKNEPPLVQQDNVVDVPNTLVGDRLIETGLEIGRKSSLAERDMCQVRSRSLGDAQQLLRKCGCRGDNELSAIQTCRTMIVSSEGLEVSRGAI